MAAAYTWHMTHCSVSARAPSDLLSRVGSSRKTPSPPPFRPAPEEIYLNAQKFWRILEYLAYQAIRRV